MVKKRVNPIPPTLRGKKRYVSFEFLSDRDLRRNDVERAVWSAFSRVFGGKGIAEQRLWLAFWSENGNKGVLRCSHLEESNVKAGILFLKAVNDIPVVPVLGKVSGSISKLKA